MQIKMASAQDIEWLPFKSLETTEIFLFTLTCRQINKKSNQAKSYKVFKLSFSTHR